MAFHPEVKVTYQLPKQVFAIGINLGQKMSGWRRLGIVVAAVWLLLVCAMALFDLDTIDSNAWERQRGESILYQQSGKTANGFFSFHRPATLQTPPEPQRLSFVPLESSSPSKNNAVKASEPQRLTFVPLEALGPSKNNPVKSESGSNSWLDDVSTAVSKTTPQSNNAKINFDDLIPTTLVEFRWLYFLFLSFGPLAFFAITAKTIQWVYDGFRVGTTPNNM